MLEPHPGRLATGVSHTTPIGSIADCVPATMSRIVMSLWLLEPTRRAGGSRAGCATPASAGLRKVAARVFLVAAATPEGGKKIALLAMVDWIEVDWIERKRLVY